MNDFQIRVLVTAILVAHGDWTDESITLAHAAAKRVVEIVAGGK